MLGICVCAILLCILAESTGILDVVPCIFTARDGLHADCSRRQLTSLAMTWPGDVVWLNASHNELEVLADLSKTGSQELTVLWNPHLASLKYLDLSYNKLQSTLHNNTFAAFKHLQWLSLQGNRLESLQADAMTGLGQLTFLDLSHNKLLARPGTYPPGVFQPLTSLQELYLHRNDDSLDGDFPEDTFAPLIALHTLALNSFAYTQFNWRFSGLRKLKVLYLYDSNIHTLTNNTFSAFHNSSLEQLHITVNNGLFGGLETCAFCHLPRLTHLAVKYARWVPLNSALSALYGLQGQTMDTIDFEQTQVHLPSSALDGHSTRYLLNICVARLSLRETNIEFVRVTAFAASGTRFRRCLQEIDMSRNRILADMIGLYAFSSYPSLTSVRMELQYVHSLQTAEWQKGHDKSDVWEPQAYKATIYVPPSLQYVNMSDGLRAMTKLPNVTSPNKLRTLDISYCRMHNCMTTVSGMSVLETFDISGSYCNPISETFFDLLPSLVHLRASNFNVDPEFFRTRAWRLFLRLERLQKLDLSHNNFVHLDPRMLRAQPHLRELNLAGNRLQSLSLDVGLHQDMQLLDLSHNMLPTLLPHERQAVDTLASKHPISLRLVGNPLLCACSNLDFVRWLWRTRVELDGDRGMSRNYTCVTETGEVSNTAAVMADLDLHWRRCHGQQLLVAASVAILLQLLVLVVVYVVTRSWTHICYVIKVMRRLRLPQRDNFRRDAYVAYAESDCVWACERLVESLEERRGVRLLLPVREILRSNVQAENIVIQMDDCWKVLLLVTQAFAEDEWLSGFTVLQAEHSITDTMPDRVIVVLLEDPARLPPMASLERLLRIVPERHVLRVHRDTPPSHPVWDRLASLVLDDFPRR